MCDDEQEMVDYISDKLREYYPDECEIKKYRDGENLLTDIRLGAFDAFFLDISMPAMDGMELAKKIRANDRYVKIIFVTNMEELAYKGYRYEAFRFVRKSRLETELHETADSLKAYFDTFKEYLSFKTPTGEIIRAVKSIKYFEAEGHAITIVSDEYEDKVCGTMRSLCDRMKNMGFILTHKSYLVNFRYICSVEKNSVKLFCGKEVPMSRKRIDEVKKQFQEFLIHVER
ncbi:MAG: response regulator transcription factor [Ruminococcaceae bacterium]|nr:response regulator transcription factor [Oscillospiraceae bacterium]